MLRVGELFQVKGQGDRKLYLDVNGTVRSKDCTDVSKDIIRDLIENSSLFIPLKQWTEKDKEDAIWVKRSIPKVKYIKRFEDGVYIYYHESGLYTKLYPSTFHSLDIGETATLEEILGE